MATLLRRCPHCNARGLDYLVIEQVKQFNLVSCGVCGAIHGVLSLAKAVPAPMVEQSIPTHLRLSASQPSLEPVSTPVKNGKTITPPVCRQHHLAMEQKTVPPGHPDAGQRIWICPRFKECHQWEKREETLFP
jgi:hypothetical protein